MKCMHATIDVNELIMEMIPKNNNYVSILAPRQHYSIITILIVMKIYIFVKL